MDNYTYFYIKLFENKGSDGKTREFKSTIKLNYPIQGAKFLKICNIFINDTVLLVKCDLIDQKFSYTNIRDVENYTDYIFNSQIVFLGYGEESNDLLKIDESKSLINEFTISVKNINNTNFDGIEMEKAFMKIKIYHE